MTSRPCWLPDILSIDGAWEDVKTQLYEVFEAGVKSGRLSFKESPVWWSRDLKKGEKHEEGFWHVITKETDGERLFDPRRAERLSWLAPVIQNSDDPLVFIWEEPGPRGRSRIHLWLKSFDYVVVLEEWKNKNSKTGKAFFLITAFFVNLKTKIGFERAYRQHHHKMQTPPQ